jgi:hypothetical protein
LAFRACRRVVDDVGAGRVCVACTAIGAYLRFVAVEVAGFDIECPGFGDDSDWSVLFACE